MVKEKPTMSEADYALKLEAKGLDPTGSAFIPDSTPMEPPLGYIKQPSIAERIRDMVRSEHLRLAAESAGTETFEEADDFDVGDDYDPHSPYENEFEPPLPPVAVDSTGVPIPPVGGTGEGAEGGIPAASAADKPAPIPAAGAAPAASTSTST